MADRLVNLLVDFNHVQKRPDLIVIDDLTTNQEQVNFYVTDWIHRLNCDRPTDLTMDLTELSNHSTAYRHLRDVEFQNEPLDKLQSTVEQLTQSIPELNRMHLL